MTLKQRMRNKEKLIGMYMNKTEVNRSTIERLHANGKYAMVAAAGCTESILQHWHDLGADMITAGTDFDFIRESAVRNCENMNRIHMGL